MSELTDERVAEHDRTCYACPEQYEGILTDGQEFYFRYRSGVASLAVGHRQRGHYADPSPLGAKDVSVFHGHDLQGIFDSAEDRNAVFSTLLDRLEAQRSAP